MDIQYLNMFQFATSFFFSGVSAMETFGLPALLVELN